MDDIEARGLAASYQDAQQRLANQRSREAAGATQLASLGSAIPAQQLKELGALSGVGAARQTQAQRGIDLARQEFEAEEAFPLRTLQEFSSILRGFPIEPTRTTKEQQFSAAQPLSTQLLGVGTQALGALGAAGIKPFGQAGGMVREMPVKAQSGGALGSLMERTQDLDTSPVIGMAKGGDILSFLSPAFGAARSAKKGGIKGLASFVSPVFAMSQGKLPMGLSSIMGSDTPPPPPPVISQEEIDKQIDAALRQRAAQGQQMASKGAPRAQVGAQMGQVRQPFKGGGGLRQMVQLPVQKMQEGGTPIYPEVSLKDIRTLGGTVPDFYDYAKAGMLGNIGVTFGPALTQEELGEMAKTAFIGTAPAALAAAEDDGGVAAEVTQAEGEMEETPKPKAPKTPAPDKKKKGKDLYRSPEEAAYASLMDSDAGQKAAERYFKGENVTLANISEALKAYKGFKDTEMAQRRAINEANIKKAAAARAARTADAELALKQGQIRTELDKPTAERIKALNSLLQAKVATLSDTYMQSLDASDPRKAKLLGEVKQLQEQLQPFLTLPSPALEKISELVGISSVKPLSKKAT